MLKVVRPTLASVLLAGTVACGVTTADILGDAAVDGASDGSLVRDAGKPPMDGAMRNGKPSADAIVTAPDSGSDGQVTSNDAHSTDGSSDARNDATPENDGGHVQDAHADGETTPDAETTEAGAATITALPAALAFGNVSGMPGFAACGTTPPMQTFTVKNVGTPTSWWAELSLGASSPYSLSSSCTKSSPCAIASGATAVVTVSPPAVSESAGIVTRTDTVTVHSVAPGDPGHTVELSESSYGAILAFDPTDQNFGGQPLSGTYTSPSLELVNSGNASATADIATTAASSSEFSLSSSQVVVPAMSSGAFTAIYKPGTSTAAVTGAVTVSVGSTATCEPLPANLTLEGQGTNAMISVTPVLDFNTNQNGSVGVSCGTAAGAQSVVVTNSGTAPASITGLTFAQGAAFTTSPSVPIVVSPGVPVNVQVIPIAISSTTPPGAILDDVLTVTTNASMDVPHRVTLHETSAGAVLSLSLPSSAGGSLLSFTSTAKGSTTAYPFTVTNSGNVAAPITLTSESGLVTFGPGVTASASANTSVSASFKPTVTGTTTTTGSLMVSAQTPTCSGFGGTVALSITGTATSGSAYSVSSTSLAFGNNSCGPGGAKGAAPASQTITMTNSGAQSSWTAALSGSGASFFELSGTTGTLNGEVILFVPGTTTVTVMPYGLGSGSGLTAEEVEFGVFATLTLTLGSGTGTETFTIPISETPNGVFANWNVSQVYMFEGSPSASFALLNASGYGATFDLSSGSGSFVLGTMTGAASNGAPLTSSLTDNATVAATTSVTASLASNTSQLCGPIPAPLPVTGR